MISLPSYSFPLFSPSRHPCFSQRSLCFSRAFHEQQAAAGVRRRCRHPRSSARRLTTTPRFMTRDILHIRNIMPCWTSLALVARPIDTRSANRVSSFLASSQTLHTVGLQTEMRNTYTHTRCNAYARQRPRDYIETVVNFNFVHPLGPRGNLRSRNAPLVQRTCMSKDTRERETGLMKNCRYYWRIFGHSNGVLRNKWSKFRDLLGI